MASEFESAQLINPTTFEELATSVTGEKGAWFRMVLGYWDMAASLVVFGAIDCGNVPRVERGDAHDVREGRAVSRQIPRRRRRLSQAHGSRVRDMPGSREYTAMVRERMRPAAARNCE
jgi:hypothetical protein